jgi:hypothetical protein
MRFALGPAALAILVTLSSACGGGASSSGSGAGAPDVATEPPATATAPASPTPPPLVLRNIRPTRLQIPSLGIDARVQESHTIPDTSVAPPGCPQRPPGQETLTVPSSGIATPAEMIDGLENKAWIFGHSRFGGVAGTFLGLQDLNIGDELFIDGVVRETAELLTHKRFVVDSIYLADTDSGEKLINASSPADIPRDPIVILQTSVREDGQGKQWILNQQKVLGKAVNRVDGDYNSYCKYLLLFIFAKPG